MCKLHKVSKGSCCYVPLIPTTPHTAAGIRIDPPPSVPKATGHRPEKNRIIENSHWLLPFVIEQTPTPPPFTLPPLTDTHNEHREFAMLRFLGVSLDPLSLNSDQHQFFS